jgi:sulfur-oxidizing protein SoxZ
MASSIRVRATASGETTEVQALIQHPMDSGFIKDAKGEIIPAHFIQQLTFEYNGWVDNKGATDTTTAKIQ